MDRYLVKIKNNHAEKMNGFTLLEIIVTIGIASIITLAIYQFFNVHSRTVHKQVEADNIQQNLRGAMAVLEETLRTAGFNPRQIPTSAAPRITDAAADAITFQADYNENGSGFNGQTGINGNVETAAEETVSIRLANGRLMQNNDIIATNIDALNFAYLDKDSNITVNMSDIRQIQVSLVVRGNRSNQKNFIQDTSYSNLQGINFFTASNDGFTRRSLSKHVICWNLQGR